MLRTCIFINEHPLTLLQSVVRRQPNSYDVNLPYLLPLPDASIMIRILAGCTTGAMAVSLAQPTDVVKVRFQAQMNLSGVARRYNGTMQAYKHIFMNEGLRGLWKGGF